MPDMKNALLIVLATLTLLACSSSGTPPAWLEEAPAAYPEADFLSAVGEAGNREDASNRALANLAKIFEVAVQDDSLDFAQARVEQVEGEARTTNRQEASRRVTTAAQQVLEGARIASHWTSSEGQAFSLAVLEKTPAAGRFREAIQDADRKTRDLMDYADRQAPNAVAALSALETARRIQVQRDAVNRNLSVVSGRGLRAPYDQSSLETMIRQALATLQFSTWGTSTYLDTLLQNGIGRLGITYNEVSNYTLEGKLDTEPIEERDGWFWLRGSLDLSLRVGEESIAQQRWPIKVSATDRGMTEQRAGDQIVNQMPAYLYELLTSAAVPQQEGANPLTGG